MYGTGAELDFGVYLVAAGLGFVLGSPRSGYVLGSVSGSFARGSVAFGHVVPVSGALDSVSLFGSAFVFVFGSGGFGFASFLGSVSGSVLAFRLGSAVLGHVLCSSTFVCAPPSGLDSVLCPLDFALPSGLDHVLGSPCFGSSLGSAGPGSDLGSALGPARLHSGLGSVLDLVLGSACLGSACPVLCFP